jgi:hypothetical protein
VTTKKNFGHFYEMRPLILLRCKLGSYSGGLQPNGSCFYQRRNDLEETVHSNLGNLVPWATSDFNGFAAKAGERFWYMGKVSVFRFQVLALIFLFPDT